MMIIPRIQMKALPEKCYQCCICLICRFSDSTLANILTPQPDVCGTKFELKIDDVLFVGHPTLAQKQNTFKVN